MKYAVMELCISGELQPVRVFHKRKDAIRLIKSMNEKYNDNGYVYFIEEVQS